MDYILSASGGGSVSYYLWNWCLGDGCSPPTLDQQIDTASNPYTLNSGAFAAAGIYRLQIRACNASGCSFASDIATLTVNESPTNVFISISPDNINIGESTNYTLSADGPVTYYNWGSCSGAGCTPTSLSETITTTNNPYTLNSGVFTVSGIFGLQIMACNADGCSENSNIATLMVN